MGPMSERFSPLRQDPFSPSQRSVCISRRGCVTLQQVEHYTRAKLESGKEQIKLSLRLASRKRSSRYLREGTARRVQPFTLAVANDFDLPLRARQSG